MPISPTNTLPSETRRLLVGSTAHQHLSKETPEALRLTAKGIEAVMVHIAALPPLCILAFDGHGKLLAVAYIGAPAIPVAQPAPIAKSRVELPTLPISGKLPGGPKYEINS